MFVYQMGDLQKVISLFIFLLVFALVAGFIIPRKRDEKLINLKASRYKTLAIIGAAVIGVECYAKLTGLVMHYFVTLNSGTSESIKWAPFETAIIFTIVVALVYLLLVGSFGLGNRLKSKIIIHY